MRPWPGAPGQEGAQKLNFYIPIFINTFNVERWGLGKGNSKIKNKKKLPITA